MEMRCVTSRPPTLLTAPGKEDLGVPYPSKNLPDLCPRGLRDSSSSPCGNEETARGEGWGQHVQVAGPMVTSKASSFLAVAEETLSKEVNRDKKGRRKGGDIEC